MIKIFLIACMITCAWTMQAQSVSEIQKIGHADWEYIFGKLPEYKQIESELKAFEGQLQTQLKIKSQDFELKLKQFNGLPPNTPETIKKDKESELAYLQDNIQKFQQDAQASVQKKQNDLVTPVFRKIGDAIEEVAKANGFSYIFNPQMIGGGDVIFYSDERYNISSLVLKKLGVTDTP